MLTTWECSGCHAQMGVGKRVEYGLPLASRPAGLAPGGVERFLLQLLMLSAKRTYGTADPADLYTRMYTVPWVPGETERLQRFLTKPEGRDRRRVQSARGDSAHQWQSLLRHACAGPASPPLQQGHRCDRHAPAARSGGHRALRGHHQQRRSDGLWDAWLSDGQAAPRGVSLADEVLYAIGVYLLSLQPPKYPNHPPADLVARGQAIFGVRNARGAIRRRTTRRAG